MENDPKNMWLPKLRIIRVRDDDPHKLNGSEVTRAMTRESEQRSRRKEVAAFCWAIIQPRRVYMSRYVVVSDRILVSLF